MKDKTEGQNRKFDMDDLNEKTEIVSQIVHFPSIQFLSKISRYIDLTNTRNVRDISKIARVSRDHIKPIGPTALMGPLRPMQH